MKLSIATLLASLCSVFQGPTPVTQDGPSQADAVVGDWEGAFEADGAAAQGIVWRFTLSAAGKLSGMMGPVQAGPVLRMADLVVTATEVSFALRSQGSFSGKLTASGIVGLWTDADASETSKLNMTKVASQEKTPREFRGSDRTWLGTAENRSSCVATGDLDGDGDLDIVIGNGRHWPQANRIFFNSGRGRFSRSVPLGISSDTTYMVMTLDIDGDQDLDILVGNEALPNVIYLNDGKGVFTRGSTFGQAGVGVRDLVAMDLNADGKPDVIEFTRGSANTIFLNDGAGHLIKSGTIGAGRDSIGAAVAGDLNGDDLIDLVLVDRDRGQNTIYMGAEAGFEEPFLFGRPGDETHDVAIADMNGDGWMDIITASIGQPNQIHFGDESQTFSEMVEFGDDSRSYAIAVGDLDNDGDMDVVIGNQTSKNTAYFNNGDGRSFKRLVYGPKAYTYDVALGDFNDNGFLDVVTANSDGHNQVFMNAAPRR